MIAMHATVLGMSSLGLVGVGAAGVLAVALGVGALRRLSRPRCGGRIRATARAGRGDGGGGDGIGGGWWLMAGADSGGTRRESMPDPELTPVESEAGWGDSGSDGGGGGGDGGGGGGGGD